MKYLLLLSLALMSAANAAVINVALNKPVTEVGVFGNSTAATPIVWSDPAPPGASTIDDGTFLADQTYWQNAVWWHEYDTRGTRYLQIDLMGTYSLVGAIVQTDNNDQYLLEYQDAANSWHPLWNIPSSCCDGVATRPNRADNTQMFNISGSVAGKAVRISGVQGDKYYSVSEVQVFANTASVPEPSSLILGAAGLGLIVVFRRRPSA